MNPEKQRLINELMSDCDEASRRAETLLAGGRVLRRRRYFRYARSAVAGLSLVVLAALGVQEWLARKPAIVVQTPTTSLSAAPSLDAHRLTDDELLGLFPDVPVGLATLSDGSKRLIFPRPEDDERFVTRL